MRKLSGINILFIFILVSTSIAASIFMIIESADFYARFYKGEQGKEFGLFAAILNETFLVIMSAVWLPKVKFGGFNLLHPGNLFIKLLMVVLFLNTVGGATFNVIEENLNELSEQQNLIKVLKLREEQLVSAKKKLDVFIEQNQPINTAIAARELAEVQSALVELQKNSKSKTTLWIDIIVLTFLRLSIQLSNITCIWIASWIYRQRNYSADNIIHGLGKDLSDLKNDLSPTAKIANIRQPSIVSQKNPSNLHSLKQLPDKQVISSLRFKNQLNTSNAPSGNKNDKILNYEDGPSQKANDIKKMIQKILKILPAQENIATLCQKLNIDYVEFKRLLNQKSGWTEKEIKKLTDIKNIIENKFDQDLNTM